MKILVLHSDIGDNAPPEELDTLIAADAVADVLARRGHKVGQAPFRAAELEALLARTAPDIISAGRRRRNTVAPSGIRVP